jgi:hypothetical protein
MKAGTTLIFLSLGLTTVSNAQTAESVAESSSPTSSSVVRERIMELLKQDVRKTPVKPKEIIAPPENPNAPANDRPVAEGVLELEPVIVTQKKPIELPPRLPKLTLDNFFYGDGKIAESSGKRVSLSVGPERKGLAALKLNIKF